MHHDAHGHAQRRLPQAVVAVVHVLEPHGGAVEVEDNGVEKVRHLRREGLDAQVGQSAPLRHAGVDLAESFFFGSVFVVSVEFLADKLVEHGQRQQKGDKTARQREAEVRTSASNLAEKLEALQRGLGAERKRRVLHNLRGRNVVRCTETAGTSWKYGQVE